MNFHHQRVHGQVDNNQIILILDELQKVDVRINGISLKIKLEQIRDLPYWLKLPDKIIFGKKSLHPAHVLEVFQILQLII